MSIKKINAILIDSANGEKLYHFYKKDLNIPLEEERHGSELHWGCFLDGVHFAIHHKPELKDQKNQLVSYSFEVSNVDEIISNLKSKKIEIFLEPEDRPYGRLAAIKDPDGNLVYLHKYPDRN